MAQCPHGYELNDGLCYSNCPVGTIVLDSNPDYCVATTPCQAGTIGDVTGTACTKVAPLGVQSLTSATCANGYTEWTAGTCYVNCNGFFLENATDCRRKLIPRRTTDPWCSSFLYTVQGSNCVLSISTLLLFLLGVFFCVFLFFVILARTAPSRGNGPMFAGGAATTHH